jgi:hypothetical protein
MTFVRPPSIGGKAAFAEGNSPRRSEAGVFTVADPRRGPDLHLVLDGVRPTRGWQDDGWFPNVVFHDTARQETQYALDSWCVPDGNRLKLIDIGYLFRQAQPTRQLG